MNQSGSIAASLAIAIMVMAPMVAFIFWVIGCFASAML